MADTDVPRFLFVLGAFVCSEGLGAGADLLSRAERVLTAEHAVLSAADRAGRPDVRHAVVTAEPDRVPHGMPGVIAAHAPDHPAGGGQDRRPPRPDRPVPGGR